MRLFVTGGGGVLGRALQPLARLAGHEIDAPSHGELDLFDPVAVGAAAERADVIVHLATRIPAPGARDPAAWRENDRLRTDATRILVDAGIAASAAAFVQPSVTFVYPGTASADEDTAVGDVAPNLRSALEAERQVARFAAGVHRRGVVLRLGLVDGPGTGQPCPNGRFGATVHIADAAAGLVCAIGAPSGVYNVCRDGERISNRRFRTVTSWHPRHQHAGVALESALAHRSG